MRNRPPGWTVARTPDVGVRYGMTVTTVGATAPTSVARSALRHMRLRAVDGGGSLRGMSDVQLSQAAYDRLKAEYDDLTTRGRTDIARTIERARELGDLSENADYHAAKDDQGRMEARIRQLQAMVDNAVIVDTSDTDEAV